MDEPTVPQKPEEDWSTGIMRILHDTTPEDFEAELAELAEWQKSMLMASGITVKGSANCLSNSEKMD